MIVTIFPTSGIWFQLVPTEQGCQTHFLLLFLGWLSQLVPTEQGCQTPRYLYYTASSSQLVPTEQGCQTNGNQLYLCLS